MENTHSFYATLTANIFVSDEDFNFIFECFQRHYDTTIKMAADVGGFLYGFRNRRIKFYDTEVITDEDRILDLSNRQIQLILKSLEMYRTDQASSINIRFHKILHELVEKQDQLNKNISGWTANLKSLESEF